MNKVTVNYEERTYTGFEQRIIVKTPVSYTYKETTVGTLEELYTMFPHIFLFDGVATGKTIDLLKKRFEYGECQRCYDKLPQGATYCISCGGKVL